MMNSLKNSVIDDSNCNIDVRFNNILNEAYIQSLPDSNNLHVYIHAVENFVENIFEDVEPIYQNDTLTISNVNFNFNFNAFDNLDKLNINECIEIFKRIKTDVSKTIRNGANNLIIYSLIHSCIDENYRGMLRNDHEQMMKRKLNEDIMKDLPRMQLFINNKSYNFNNISITNVFRGSDKCDYVKLIKLEIQKMLSHHNINDDNDEYLYKIYAFLTQQIDVSLLASLHEIIVNTLINEKNGINVKYNMMSHKIKPTNMSKVVFLEINDNEILINIPQFFTLNVVQDDDDKLAKVGHICMFYSFNLMTNEAKVVYNIEISYGTQNNNIPNSNNSTNIFDNKFKQFKQIDNKTLGQSAAVTAVGLSVLSAIPMALLLGGKSKKNKYKNKYNHKLKKYHRTKRNKCMQNKSQCQNKNKKYKNNKRTRRK